MRSRYECQNLIRYRQRNTAEGILGGVVLLKIYYTLHLLQLQELEFSFSSLLVPYGLIVISALV